MDWIECISYGKRKTSWRLAIMQGGGLRPPCQIQQHISSGILVYTSSWNTLMPFVATATPPLRPDNFLLANTIFLSTGHFLG